jgi:Fic family protein
MINTPEPKFNSRLTEIIIDLEHLRGRGAGGTTSRHTFLQLKNLFHTIEALSSARIEGNHTTLARFVEKRAHGDDKSESMREIINLMNGLDFIDNYIGDTKIDRDFVLELHRIVVDGLQREGDSNAGGWRRQDVTIGDSKHNPPSHYDVAGLMRELFNYIDEESDGRNELLKIALTHHQFVHIHPFGNGNGRTVRLLTYAMLCKKGYIESNALRLFNPTAVFAGDRQRYYDMLELADSGDSTDLLTWCEYFLSGIKDETEKTLRLADGDFVRNRLVLPAIRRLNSSGVLSVMEASILERAAKRPVIKAADIADLWQRQVGSSAIANQIKRLRDTGYLVQTKPNGREYILNFIDNKLTRLVLDQMEIEDLLPIRVDDLSNKA